MESHVLEDRRVPGHFYVPTRRTAIAGLQLVVVLSLGVLFGCAKAGPELAPVRSVILVTLGEMRADTAAASAALEPLRRESLTFERAYAPSSLAVQSLASLFIGRLPTHGGTIGVSEAQPPQAATTLATRLRRGGWQTAIVAAQPWASRAGFTRGFGAVEIPTDGRWSAFEVTRRALRTLEAYPDVADREPLFLNVHYSMGFDHTAAVGNVAVSRKEYAEQAAEVLKQVAVLTQETSERGGVFVLAGLSGFELGEHGAVGSGFTVFEETVRVPLLVRWDEVRADSVQLPTSVADVGTTILELVNLAADDGEVTGASLLSATGAGYSPRTSAEPVLTEVVVREWAIARAVVGERYKYLHVSRDVPAADRRAVREGLVEIQSAMSGGGTPVPPLFGEAVREELYDLESDPGESRSVLADNPAELGRLRAMLRDYRRICESTGYRPGEILDRLEVDPEKMRELESLGYL